MYNQDTAGGEVRIIFPNFFLAEIMDYRGFQSFGLIDFFFLNRKYLQNCRYRFSGKKISMERSKISLFAKMSNISFNFSPAISRTFNCSLE